MQVSASVLAYMDDTLWLAQPFQQLQQILQTVESFYAIAQIQANPQKSILTSNTKHVLQLPFMNSTISA